MPSVAIEKQLLWPSFEAKFASQMGQNMRIALTFAAALLASTLLGQTSAPVPSAPTTPAANATNPAAQHENYDPLLDLPPLPHKQVTLIGGTVVTLDEVMNRLVLRPFGTKQQMKVAFDTRTRFYRDGNAITLRDVKQGQRVYLDTMLNGSRVFAKTIWIQTAVQSGLARGQIVDFDSGRGILTVRDELSNQPLKMNISASTQIRKGDGNGTTRDLVEGALVSLSFSVQRDLQQITVLATPGTVFSFAGRVSYLDLSRKMIAIDNRSDRNKYDISVEAIAPNVIRRIREGGEISVSAVFDGNRYDARNIEFPAGSTPE